MTPEDKQLNDEDYAAKVHHAQYREFEKGGASKYRCETCSKMSSVDCPIEKKCFVDNMGFAYQRTLMHDITALIGCASHSEFKDCEKRIEETVNELRHRANMMFDAGIPMMVSISDVLKLLEGGVEK